MSRPTTVAVSLSISLSIAAFAAPLEASANPTPRPVDVSGKELFGHRWHRDVVRTGTFRQVIDSFGRPAISERHGIVIVAQGEGMVQGLNLHDGAALWSFRHSAPFESDITLLQLRVPRAMPKEIALVSARDGTLLALESKNGVLLWSVALEHESRAPISVAENRLFVTTSANKVHAIDKESGKKLWSAGRTKPSGLTVQGHSIARYHEGRVYVGYSDGYLEAYDAASGERQWSRLLSLGGSEFVDVDADPWVQDGLVYAASYSDGIFALRSKDGSTVWQQPASAVVSLSSFENRILVASSDGWIWGLGPKDGERLFRTRMPNGPLSRMVVARGIALLSAGESGLVVLNARNGQPLQATPLGGRIGGPPAWVGEHVALLSTAGAVHTFALPN